MSDPYAVHLAPKPPDRSQLADLAAPFKGHYVAEKPGGHGARYVEHNYVTERLLLHLGGYSFETVEIIRGDYLTKDGETLPNIVQGAVCRLTCEVDGKVCVIEEAGDVEHPANWNTEGARMKAATSDAIKRCAMRLGLGLHLWSGEGYFLDRALAKSGAASPPDGGTNGSEGAAPSPKDQLAKARADLEAAKHEVNELIDEQQHIGAIE